MERSVVTAAACGLPLLLGTMAAAPAAADELSDMRQDIQQMRQQYEGELQRLQKSYEIKLQQMEQRLKVAEDKADAAQKAAEAALQPPIAAAPWPQAAPAPTPGGSAPASAGAFNPAIGVVLQGQATSQSLSPDSYRLPGFALGDSAGPLPRGLSINESEINLQANVDQALYGNLTLAFHPENTVSVEEGFIQSTSLPYGLTLRGGRFFSGIGYLNEQHAHTWDFADQALPYQAFLNTQYDDDGVQVRWLAPTSRFLEFGGEALRGDAFPAGGTSNHNSGVGAWSAFVHTGDDIGESASYRVGLSYLHTSAKDRTTNDVDGSGARVTDIFSGTDNTYIAEGVYQFMPQWRVGVRYDQVQANSLGPTFAGTTLDNLGATPRRYTAMIDYSTSEFGRFRLQYENDHSRPQTANEFILQYIVSLGAHGAHQY